MIIRRVRARFWLAFLITAWGACVLEMGFVHKTQLRWPILCSPYIFGLVALLVMLYAKLPAGRDGLFLATFGAQANMAGPLTYGQIQTGRPENKGVAAATIIAAGAVGVMCESTIFRNQDAPQYLPGMW